MKPRYVPVKGRDGLYRDSSSGAIVNKNTSEFEKYVANRDKMISDKQRIDNLEDKVDNLSSDISDIKNLLQSFLNNNK